MPWLWGYFSFTVILAFGSIPLIIFSLYFIKSNQLSLFFKINFFWGEMKIKPASRNSFYVNFENQYNKHLTAAQLG